MTTFYNIKRTDGSTAFTIQPSTVNGASQLPGAIQRSTDLTFYGSGSIEWGKEFNENFLRLLENFSCPALQTGESLPAYLGGVGFNTDYDFPTHGPCPQDELQLDGGVVGSGNGINSPAVGQMWFNTRTTTDGITAGLYYVWTGLEWRTITQGTAIADITDLQTTLDGIQNQISANDLDIAQNVANILGNDLGKLSLDGSDTMTGVLNMGGQAISNIADPISGNQGMDRDYADGRYVQQSNLTPVLEVVYPVGAIYISTSAANPATIFGFGTWAQTAEGRMLIGEGTGGGATYAAGGTGGSKDALVLSHTHSINHNHPATTTNSAGAHVHQSPHRFVSDDSGSAGAASGDNDSGPFVNTGSAGAHTHTVDLPNYNGNSGSAGSSGTNANLPPYLVTYIWERLA